MDKLPEGPALLVYYHGVIPVDMYYFMAQLLINKQRHLRCVGDRFLFKIPGKSSFHSESSFLFPTLSLIQLNQEMLAYCKIVEFASRESPMINFRH